MQLSIQINEALHIKHYKVEAKLIHRFNLGSLLSLMHSINL